MIPRLSATGLKIAGRLGETSLRMDAPELLCVVGPNGSGKTSLLHAIAGIGASRGEVRIDGVDPRRLGPDARRQLLAFLPATRDVAWPLTARDLVALGLPAGDDRARVDKVLAGLELEGLAERRLDRLSTGERSRVLIARALVARPRLLLLDEPVANLDPLWQLRLMEELRRLTREKGQAVVMAVHDLAYAERYADRLLVMREGAVEAEGDPRRLIASPVIASVFGVERDGGLWRPINPPAGPRSSR